MCVRGDLACGDCVAAIDVGEGTQSKRIRNWLTPSEVDEAAKDGVITAARSQKAHEDIRVLGNEVVHDDWRPVDETEVESALHYAQRVLEALYDDRDTVERF